MEGPGFGLGDSFNTLLDPVPLFGEPGDTGDIALKSLLDGISETGPGVDDGLDPSVQPTVNELGTSTDENKFDFQSLLFQSVRDTTSNDIKLPWETDEWACIFDPNYDVTSALVPPFEPKLKMQKLVHPEVFEEDQRKLVLRDAHVDDRLPFQLAISGRNDATRVEKREAELQRALKKWVSIVAVTQ